MKEEVITDPRDAVQSHSQTAMSILLHTFSAKAATRKKC
jgi:hypothetical protein